MIEPLLRRSRTVWVYDRRGHGASGDASHYSIDREAEDVLAVPVDVVAHSYGAVCVLLALDRAPVRSLAMDEPPLFASRVDPSERDQPDRLLQQSDLDRALGRFLRAYADAQDDELSFLSSLPDVWSRLLQGTQTLGRELDAVSGDVVSALTAPSIPTLALRGADTTCPNFPKAEELLSLFPGIEISQIPGQRHLGMAFAPDAVKTRLTEFWDRVSA